ncbi:hypothetical protein ACLOJK_031601 [Asimina triloba]
MNYSHPSQRKKRRKSKRYINTKAFGILESFCWECSSVKNTSRPETATWLKALSFSTINRARYPPQAHHRPLLTNNPHELVPFLELNLYVDNRISHLHATAAAARSPALVSTHLTHSALPQSVKDSNCKIVYLCRNPRDVLVSRWYFASGIIAMDKAKSSSISVEDAFEMFCAGFHLCGPYWEHLLEYWKACLENPHKVLFLKYEDLKKEPVPQLKRLAEFLGYPFTPKEEEEDGVIQDILQLCSFESLSNLEVNKAGEMDMGNILVERKLFFRRGEVGDSANHLTPQMIQHLDRITEQKFQGSGLTFQVSA